MTKDLEEALREARLQNTFRPEPVGIDTATTLAGLVRPIFNAARKNIADGEAIVARANEELGLSSGGPGTDERAWRVAPVPKLPDAMPDLLEAVPFIVDGERNGRWVAAALTMTRLKMVYDGLSPSQIAPDVQTWRAFVTKFFPFGFDRADELLGKMIRRGGFMRCTKCGSESKAPCDCGAPCLIDNPVAAMLVEAPAKTALERAAEAIAADPSRSNRLIAKEIGVNEATVRRARKDSAPDSAPTTIPSRPQNDNTPPPPDDGTKANGFIRDLLEFTTTFVRDFENSDPHRELSAEDRDAVALTLNQCAHEFMLLIQSLAKEVNHGPTLHGA